MMKKVIGFAVVASLLATAGTSFAKEDGKHLDINGNNTITNQATSSFDDENGESWAKQFIEYVGKKGYMHGDKGSKHFRPTGQLSRAEFAAVFNNKFQVEAATTPINFTDVPQSSWAYKAVEALTTHDYLDYFKSGQSTYYFNPAKAVTREDVAVTLVKAYNLPLMDAQSAAQLLQQHFKDAADVAPALVPYVATAVQHNIMLGDGSKFRPLDPLNRAETAALLYKLDTTQIVVGAPTDGQTTVTGDTYGSTTSTGTVTGDTYGSTTSGTVTTDTYGSAGTNTVDTTGTGTGTNSTQATSN